MQMIQQWENATRAVCANAKPPTHVALNSIRTLQIVCALITTFPLAVYSQGRLGKTCTWDGMPGKPIAGFDCYLQRGSFTYSSHNSPYIYIPDCQSPKDSYVISGYASGKCPDKKCQEELRILLQKTCR